MFAVGVQQCSFIPEGFRVDVSMKIAIDVQYHVEHAVLLVALPPTHEEHSKTFVSCIYFSSDYFYAEIYDMMRYGRRYLVSCKSA